MSGGDGLSGMATTRVGAITEFLDGEAINYEVIEHEPTIGAAEIDGGIEGAANVGGSGDEPQTRLPAPWKASVADARRSPVALGGRSRWTVTSAARSGGGMSMASVQGWAVASVPIAFTRAVSMVAQPTRRRRPRNRPLLRIRTRADTAYDFGRCAIPLPSSSTTQPGSNPETG